MHKLPKSKTTDVLIQRLSNRILIFDKTANELRSLNEISTIVYQACATGEVITFDELKMQKSLTDEEIFTALEDLKRDDLLENNENPALSNSTLTGYDATRKINFVQWLCYQ